jgi:flagellin
MPAVLNTNVASLWASKNLLGAQEKMANSVERLSSGLRINRARDDAAGLGVANALTSQINSANQGIRNLNDGISMVQTAEASITSASDMGQRILTLATQGANAPLGIDERKSIQAEMAKLLDAMDSIGKRAKFSDNELLKVSTLDSDVNTATKYSLQISREGDDKVNLTKAAFQNIGYGATAVDEKVVFTFSRIMASGETLTLGNRTVRATGTVSVADVVSSFATGVAVGATVVSGTLDTGWSAAASGGNTVLTLSKGTGADVADLGNTAYASDLIATRTYTQGASVSGGHASDLKVKVDALSVLLNASPTVLADISTKFTEIQAAAKKYVVDVGTQRSLLGAYQNQIEYTVSNVTDLSGNLTAARSRVQDTDYAAETANLTKGQILQQAATAMLAQANQMPNVILTLLK